MARNASLTAAVAVASLMICAASPPDAPPPAVTSSERSTMTVGHEAVPTTPTIPPRGWRRGYLLPLAPKDTRSPRERCVDQEIAKEGGSPSGLALAAIDLKCSQR